VPDQNGPCPRRTSYAHRTSLDLHFGIKDRLSTLLANVSVQRRTVIFLLKAGARSFAKKRTSDLDAVGISRSGINVSPPST